MRVVNIDNLEWIQITVKETKDKAILILKPHINDLDWFEAEPVRHGRWEEYQIPHIICCSECDYGTCVDEKTKFCPNCGAKMDLGKD